MLQELIRDAVAGKFELFAWNHHDSITITLLVNGAKHDSQYSWNRFATKPALIDRFMLQPLIRDPVAGQFKLSNSNHFDTVSSKPLVNDVEPCVMIQSAAEYI